MSGQERVSLMTKVTAVLAVAVLAIALGSVALADHQGTYGYGAGHYHNYWAGEVPEYRPPCEMDVYTRNTFYPEAYRYGYRNHYVEHGMGWRGHDMYRYYHFGDRDSVPMPPQYPLPPRNLWP